jgi:citrate synthase
MLESDEAARRLGVKMATLYAYVSRGLLVSHPSPTGRRRLFDMDEVERLACRSRHGKAVETRMATITTGVTQLTDDGPVYRGLRATDLATRWRYEEVAGWLWGVEVEGGGHTGAGAGGHGRAGDEMPDVVADGRRAPEWRPLDLGPPPGIGSSDRLRWAVVMAGSLDHLRSDLRPEAVIGAARRVAASMVQVLPAPVAGPTDRDPGPGATPPGRSPVASSGEIGDPVAGETTPDLSGSMAERLASALTPSPTADLVRAVNAAMVLMADHELATSTLAVRLAASTRADIYDALLVALGTIAGPLHGGASQLAFSLLVDAQRDGPERALDDTLRWQRVLPGFGHAVYKHGDARFGVLLGLFEQMARPDQIELVRSLVGAAADHSIPPPNVDLALAAISWSTGMPPDAGRTLFTVARVAGWAAHYLEELGERPLRYRARAVYAAHRTAT